MNLDKDNIPAAALKKLEKITSRWVGAASEQAILNAVSVRIEVLGLLVGISGRPEFHPELVGKQSVAALSLCLWSIAIGNYAKMAKAIEPKKLKVEEMNQKASAVATCAEGTRPASVQSKLCLNRASLLLQLQAADAALLAARSRCTDIEAKLGDKQKELDAQMEETRQLQEEADLCQLRLERAKYLTKGLAEEAVRCLVAASRALLEDCKALICSPRSASL